MPRPNWVDDRTILDEFGLWRGLQPTQIKEVGGKSVPSTGAFVTTELSASVVQETTPDRVIAKGAAHGYDWRLWEFPVTSARDPGCLVDRDPITEQDDEAKNDPAHAIVVHAEAPQNPNKRITPGQAKSMISNGHWEDEPK